MERKKMDLVKVTDRIYYLPEHKETDRPYLYYIKGSDYSIAVDAGYSKEHVSLFYDAIRAEGLPLPQYTVMTHWHWDHTFGIPYVVGETIANELTRQKLISVSKWQWTEEAMDEREKTGEDIIYCNNSIKMVYPDLAKIKVQTVDRGISEMMELDLGDICVQLYPMDSIHSRDAMLIFVPEEKALFVGDADCEDHYEEHGKANPQRVKAYKAFVSQLDFDKYFLGHDLPDNKEGVMKYLDELGGLEG